MADCSGPRTTSERRAIFAIGTTKEILEYGGVAFNLRPVIPRPSLLVYGHFRTSRSGRPRSAFNQKEISTLGCSDRKPLERKAVRRKQLLNPIAAFYKDPMQAWIYANSQASETRDALGPDSWDSYNELRKYSSTSLQSVDPEKAFKKWLGKKAPK
jgi:hypothetical protein